MGVVVALVSGIINLMIAVIKGMVSITTSLIRAASRR
jgi:hypothetical protein